MILIINKLIGAALSPPCKAFVLIINKTTMQLADAAEAIAIDAGLQVYFIYYGWMGRDDVPEDVTHVRIDSSVRAIRR